MGNVEAFDEKLVHAEQKIAIYGTTPCGIMVKECLENIGLEVSIFIDRIRVQENYVGVPIFHFEEIADFNDYLIINCTSANFWNINKFLFDNGIETVYHGLSLLSLGINRNLIKNKECIELYKHYVNKEDDDSIYKVSAIITERCSLRCKYCTEYMPHIPGGGMHADVDVCIKSITNLLDAIGKLESITIIGGEVFTHPQWEVLVKWCVDEERIQEVRVLTNSTIVPSKREILRNKKVVLMLDDYGKTSRKLDELKSIAIDENIRYVIYKHDYWYDVLGCEYVDESSRELIKKYEVCRLKGCWNISDGFLYKCVTSYYKMKYKLSREIGEIEDFIDLLNSDSMKIRESVIELSQKKYLEACKYCIGTGNDNIVDVAEQL